jgi:uncharacterized protein
MRAVTVRGTVDDRHLTMEEFDEPSLQAGQVIPKIEPERVTFLSEGREVVGYLRRPRVADPDARQPSVVVVGPGSAVKEQAGAVYAERLAANGYATIVFDPSFQGESAGTPRDLESPAARIEDIRCAVDFLVTRDFIDEHAIGLLGICAGGGYAVSAAMIERRFKAVGTVVANDIGSAFRRTSQQAGGLDAMLAEVGRLRTAAARGGEQQRMAWLPSAEEARAAGIDDPSLLNAIDYYDERGRSVSRTNKRLSISDALLAGYDAFHLAGELLVQPLQVIVGGRLGTTFSYEGSKSLWERARNRRDFVVIDGADHYDLYDKPQYVSQAIKSLVALYDTHLRAPAGSR